MAGKFRRKFENIIIDKFIDHYRGKVTEQALCEVLDEIKKQVVKLENSKKDNVDDYTETFRLLRRLPLDKLKEFLAEEA